MSLVRSRLEFKHPCLKLELEQSNAASALLENRLPASLMDKGSSPQPEISGLKSVRANYLKHAPAGKSTSISGPVVKCIVAIDVAQVELLADPCAATALLVCQCLIREFLLLLAAAECCNE